MIPRQHRDDREGSAGLAAWKELDQGTSTICAFAELCRQAIIFPPTEPIQADQISVKAQAILASTPNRGVVDIRGKKDEFDSVERFLAVCVEVEADRRLLFRRRDDPQQTVEFLDAFGELCRAGLMIHHLGRDFSFSATGFALAKSLNAEQLSQWIEFGVEVEH
jgi:hypothetical protein